MRKKKSNILLHCAFVGLHIYYSNYNKLPALNDLKQTKEIVELSKQYYFIIKEKYPDYLKLKKKNIIEFDENYIINVLRWSKSEINPICTFLGGIVSQEALKIIGKYTPIYQWLRFDFFKTIENISNKVNRNPLNCRYDDQIAIFGRELQEKLNNLNIFMVGAGALGCEYIKNFCLMGISSGNGKITITDNDNISLSNLNRQFLFHINDIKENLSKSFCARREAMKINKDMNIKSYQLLVNDDTRNIFDDEFIDKQNILISAVDNIEARKFIDNLSTFYNKIFIDSGTEGTKANSDIYYPNESICLNDLEFNEKEEIPMCTLKFFPSKIEHCIEFSKNAFIDLFEQPINDLKLIPKNEEKFKQILEETNDQIYLHIEVYKNIFYILENPTFDLIIKFAYFVFKYYFQYNINKILKDNQKSFLNQNYNKKPSPLEIDLKEKNTILFFKSFYFIISYILNFNQDFDLDK
jgi:ubiquitin-activating enzyme E1